MARQKVGGTHLKYHVKKQLPSLPPEAYRDQLNLIVQIVLELTYTASDMKPFYEAVISENPEMDTRAAHYRGSPWPWNPERRAMLRAQLDATYARLYGLSREDLRYILDPADVMGDGYPSETFRGLKNKEIRNFGEYRTRRLVLEAWDRMEARQ